jgi:alkanesulfonate monooxygenase SsuD/methylene tetrahydromethanopterin reductase-like flavin-dependent oxidoreductase (luciferase family)
VLGLAPGGREDDYVASGVDFHSRGRTFDRQLDEMREIWSGGGELGPPPANGRAPELLVGGGSEVAFRRAAKHADGWTFAGGTPDVFAGALAGVRDAWRAAGREGEPRTVVLFYFALGPDAEQVAARGLGDYYAFAGDYAQQIVGSAAKDEQTVQAYLAAFDEAGADEAICFPATPDPDQVELLARAAGL